jgi:hypothetical protein
LFDMPHTFFWRIAAHSVKCVFNPPIKLPCSRFVFFHKGSFIMTAVWMCRRAAGSSRLSDICRFHLRLAPSRFLKRRWRWREHLDCPNCPLWAANWRYRRRQLSHRSHCRAALPPSVLRMQQAYGLAATVAAAEMTLTPPSSRPIRQQRRCGGGSARPVAARAPAAGRRSSSRRRLAEGRRRMRWLLLLLLLRWRRRRGRGRAATLPRSRSPSCGCQRRCLERLGSRRPHPRPSCLLRTAMGGGRAAAAIMTAASPARRRLRPLAVLPLPPPHLLASHLVRRRACPPSRRRAAVPRPARQCPAAR